MGRVFEKRKHKMFARYNKMSRTSTKIGKEIAIAVKAGGGDPDGNSRLRAIIANAISRLALRILRLCDLITRALYIFAILR